MFRVGSGSRSVNGGIEVVYRQVRAYLDRSYRGLFAKGTRRQSGDVKSNENLMLDSSSLVLP